MKIYLAGPMRGLADWNFAAFDEARERFTTAGHQVFCPAAMFRAMPYLKTAGMTQDRGHLVHVIQQDLACIYQADAIALLPGWQRSQGVAVELATAQFLGLKVLCAVTGDRLVLPFCPWSNAVELTVKE